MKDSVPSVREYPDQPIEQLLTYANLDVGPA